MARHKAPSAFARATRRIGPPLQALHLRRTGGTVVALSAVVLAGAAGNGSQTSAADEPVSPQPATQRPSADVTRAVTGERAARATEASRSRPRDPLSDQTRSQVLAERRDHDSSPSVGRTGAHTAQAETPVPTDPRAVARSMLADYGWDVGEFSCLDQLWVSESDWETRATNPTSGAYGIPQALPAQKMASAGSDWRTNPATQIEWGLRYIDLSYGTPCSAWEFKQANNWY